MREMTISSIEEGKVKYVEESYLNKIIDMYYPWLAKEREDAIKSRIDKWNQIFGN